MKENQSHLSGGINAAQNAKQGTIPCQDPFPFSGNVRPKQAAEHLSIGLSSLWLFIKQGRIDRPLKFSTRVSVFPASYIRHLAENGIPDKVQEVKNVK